MCFSFPLWDVTARAGIWSMQCKKSQQQILRLKGRGLHSLLQWHGINVEQDGPHGRDDTLYQFKAKAFDLKQ